MWLTFWGEVLNLERGNRGAIFLGLDPQEELLHIAVAGLPTGVVVEGLGRGGEPYAKKGEGLEDGTSCWTSCCGLGTCLGTCALRGSVEVLEKEVLPLEIKFLIYLVCHLDSFQFLLVCYFLLGSWTFDLGLGLLTWVGYLSLVWDISARSWSIDWIDWIDWGVGVGLGTWGFPGKWDGSALLPCSPLPTFDS